MDLPFWACQIWFLQISRPFLTTAFENRKFKPNCKLNPLFRFTPAAAFAKLNAN